MAIPWHSSLRAVNRGDDRYLSPKLGSTTTISLPANSGRRATLTAATTAAPEDMPQKIPSSRAKRVAILIDSSLLTCARLQIYRSVFIERSAVCVNTGVHARSINYLDDLIEHLCVQHPRHKTSTNALNLMRPWIASRQDWAFTGLHSHYMEV